MSEIAWAPPARPEWVERANREISGLDLEAAVPLTPGSLIAAATSQTGLSDFGTDEWREPFALVCRALDEEAHLNFLGRVLTRADMIATLAARLRVEEAYRLYPEIEQEVIEAPILIVGQGRTGTSALLNLLAADPANAITRTWQVMHPEPADDPAPMIASANAHVAVWNEVAPALQAIHEFSGEIPTESIHVQSLTFQAPAWQVIYGQTPSHYAYMASRSRVPAIAYEKRVLKLLQWRRPKRRWVLKSPDALNYLPDVLEVFPDVGLVWTHRDPVVALASAISVVGTLAWARSDRPLAPGVAAAVTDLDACGTMLSRPIDWIETGRLPRERIVHIQYRDFVADPLETVGQIYRHFGIRTEPGSLDAMATYLAAHPRSNRPSHGYDAHGALDARRAVFRAYQDYFSIPSET